jgi:preprotein translocase subunit SecA
VHVVTVNDYLAKRDAAGWAKLYSFLGLTTGIIVHGLDDEERQRAYACDITYGTNNEFGFDYLRDNMKYEVAQMVQRGHFYAIVDEVDSILVDEARTPLIISGPLDDKSDLYVAIDKILPGLVAGHRLRSRREAAHGLADRSRQRAYRGAAARCRPAQGRRSLRRRERHARAPRQPGAARAFAVHRDKDYIVRDDEVVIIDEFTGRMMPGRRYSEGLHQALEAKEHVTVQPENADAGLDHLPELFPPVFQARRHDRHGATEADEFFEIYKLEVVEIPTNVPVARMDEDDEVYRTFEEKVTRRHPRDQARQARPAHAGRHHLDRALGAVAEICRRKATSRSTSPSRRRWSRSMRPPAPASPRNCSPC